MSIFKRMLTNSQKAEVRLVRDSDWVQLPAIYYQSLKDNPDGFVQDVAYHGDITVIGKQILERKGALLVAAINEKVVGFGALKPEPGADSVELCKLHVSKAYQGLGIGKQLSQRLLSLANELGYGLVTLHVTTTQKAAIRLYEKLGFYKTGQQIFNLEVNQQVREYDTLFMEYPTTSAPHGGDALSGDRLSGDSVSGDRLSGNYITRNPPFAQ